MKDFHLLVRLRVFNTEHMNAAVFAFRRYEDASLRYTGIESHDELRHYGLYDTVVAKERLQADNTSNSGESVEHRISEWLNSQLPQGSWESVASALTLWLYQKEIVTLDDIDRIAETATAEEDDVHMVLTALTSGPHPLFKQFFYDLKQGESELITNEMMNQNLERRESEPEAWKAWAQNVGVAWKKN